MPGPDGLRPLRQMDEARRLRSTPSARIRRVRSWPSCGIVIGIVTVVLVASVLVNLRNQVALLFRELGTENIFAFHLTGDPYSGPSEREASRRPLDPKFARDIERRSTAVREVGVQIIVPNIVNGRALVARAGGNESADRARRGRLGQLFRCGRGRILGRTAIHRSRGSLGRTVAIIGADSSRALFGGQSAIGRSVTLAGESYAVVAELHLGRAGSSARTGRTT